MLPGLRTSPCARYEVASAAFEEHFRRLLQQHNIDLEDGVVLAATADGEVQVIGEHPHKQVIEQLFRDDTELRGALLAARCVGHIAPRRPRNVLTSNLTQVQPLRLAVFSIQLRRANSRWLSAATRWSHNSPDRVAIAHRTSTRS